MQELSKEKLTEIYATLLKVRRLEERLVELFQAGEIPGWIHSGLGEEAVGVGASMNLRPGDYITATHRARSVSIPRGVDLKLFMAEAFGRIDGTCKGRAGEMRFMDIKHGVLQFTVTIGEHISFAAGTAFSSQVRGTDQVSVAFFGDGNVDTGLFHETMNVASLWKLPMVFVCENNGWAQFVPQKDTASVPDVGKKAAAYNMPGVTVDGNDILAVYRAAGEAIARARRGEGPTLVECKTSRWLGHFVGDPQKYRDPKDIEAAHKSDPVPRLQERLLQEKVLTPQLIEQIEKKIKAEIDEAIEFASKSPWPTPDEALKDLYCEA